MSAVSYTRREVVTTKSQLISSSGCAKHLDRIDGRLMNLQRAFVQAAVRHRDDYPARVYAHATGAARAGCARFSGLR